MTTYFHNVNLSALRPTDASYATAEKPEGGPGSLHPRQLNPRFGTSVREREFPLNRVVFCLPQWYSRTNSSVDSSRRVVLFIHSLTSCGNHQITVADLDVAFLIVLLLVVYVQIPWKCQNISVTCARFLTEPKPLAVPR